MAAAGCGTAVMRRVSVVGSSGAGKTTFGRELACRMGAPFTELDSIHHLADWAPVDPDEFLRSAEELAAGDRWVIDGNYGAVVRDGPIWGRADTVIWLDVPKRVALWQVTRRTVRRAATGEELWNGNRERWSDVLSRDPERSMICWVWTTHGEVRGRYERLVQDPELAHLRFVRLRSRREMRRFLDGVRLSRRRGRSGTG